MDEEPTAQRPRVITALSDSEPKNGLVEVREDQGEKVSISDAARGLGLEETPDDRLRGATLRPIVKFFVTANGITEAGVFTLALLEMTPWMPSTHTAIITDKVIIALIAGLTVQVGAVIIVAFKGLFAASAQNRSPNGP